MSESGVPDLIGPYRVVRALARGGMGSVFVAVDPAGREVALKLLHRTLAHGEARFEVEAQAAGRLQHAGIVSVHDFGRDARGRPYLVMELVEGESLQQRLERGGPLPPREAVRVVHQVAEALEHAHSRGVLHRDLKPDNILLTDGRAVITDFGLARVVDQSQHLTQTGQFLGTPAYMPPEQVRGDKEHMGPASDVYALGATLHALLTGEPPFVGGPPAAQLAAALEQEPRSPSDSGAPTDDALDWICLTCLAKDPGDRYPTAAALAEDLARWERGERVLARGRRRPRLLVALAGVAVLLFATLVVIFARGDEVDPSRRDPAPPAVASRLAPASAGDAPAVSFAESRATAVARAMDLCGNEPPDVEALLHALEDVARATSPPHAPGEGEDPALGDAVIDVVAGLEQGAPEQLGDAREVALVQALARARVRPRTQALVVLFQCIRLTVRPRGPVFRERAYALMLALVELELEVTENAFKLIDWARWTSRPAPRTPEEKYLQLRLSVYALGGLDARGHSERIRRLEIFCDSDSFERLGPRNRAHLLFERVALDTLGPGAEALAREALALHPSYSTMRFALARWLIRRARERLEAGDVEGAQPLLAEACEQGDRAVRDLEPALYVTEAKAIGVAVNANVLAGNVARAEEIVALVPDEGDARRRLQTVLANATAERTRLFPEAGPR